MNYPITAVICLGVSLVLHYRVIPFFQSKDYKRGPFPVFRKITYLRIIGFYKMIFIISGFGYLFFFLFFEIIASRIDFSLFYSFDINLITQYLAFFGSTYTYIGLLLMYLIFTFLIYGYSHVGLMRRFQYLRTKFNRKRLASPREYCDSNIIKLEDDLAKVEQAFVKLAEVPGIHPQLVQREDKLLEGIDYLVGEIKIKKWLKEEEEISVVIQRDMYKEIEKQIHSFLFYGNQAWKAFFSGKYLRPAGSRKKNRKYIVAICLLVFSIWIIQAGQCVHSLASNYMDVVSTQLASQGHP